MFDGNQSFRLELCIANLTDGTKIAYVKRYIEKADSEINEKIKKAETAGQTRLNQPSDDNIAQEDQVVNTNSENSSEEVKESRKIYDPYT